IAKHRQADDEFAALPRTFASRFDTSLVHLDQALHESQADAEAGARPIELRVRLREHVEYGRELLLRYPDSLVANLDDDLVALPLRGQLNLPASLGIRA